MSRKSWLSEGGVNLFQEIKAVCTEAEQAGQTLFRLSIGQPSGPALLPAREIAADAVMSDQEQMHEYQDNGSPGVPSFAQRFVNCHTGVNVLEHDVLCLPTPGTKPMLGFIPLACGANQNKLVVLTTTKPGYPTPADWLAYLGLGCRPAVLNPDNAFLVNPEEMDGLVKLGMFNYPHNPSGQIATRAWWTEICERAQATGARIFNDAAYSILAHSPDHCNLTDVAVNFPDLSWAEAFSSSKAGNFTGWRIGAIAGSPDFVGDIAKIKGNTDSGFAAPLAAGVLVAFEDHRGLIEEVGKMYRHRIKLLIEVLTHYGMRLAVEPGAGFFTLWQSPNVAFGKPVKDAREFNFRMIQKTGVVGVHFNPYIRYAVCGDVEVMIGPIEEAFKKAQIEY